MLTKGAAERDQAVEGLEVEAGHLVPRHCGVDQRAPQVADADHESEAPGGEGRLEQERRYSLQQLALVHITEETRFVYSRRLCQSSDSNDSTWRGALDWCLLGVCSPRRGVGAIHSSKFTISLVLFLEIRLLTSLHLSEVGICS